MLRPWRKDHDIQERSMSLKRKRIDYIVHCYQSLEELGIALDSSARVHLLDSVALLTKQEIGVDGEII